MNSQQNNWKQWLAAGMLVTASVFTACQSSSDYKSIDSDAPAGDATTMDSTQGNAVDESMTSRDNVSDRPVTNPDGSTNPDMINPGTATNKTSAMPKKGTKGRASINMADMRGSKTASSAMRDADGIYSRADVMPMYPGGEDALQKFVEDNIEYPEQAIENGAEGDVRVVFTVDEKGRVTNIKATGDNNVEYGMKEEAVAVMNKMPAWTPGKVNGKNVKTRMTLPIVYRIEQ